MVQTEPDIPRMQDLRRYRQNQIYTKVAGPRMVQTESDAPRLQDLGRQRQNHIYQVCKT